ncbi:preprotein translocase subunit SecY [Candidatus Woesearchaeota archaeon]|nr:preprotein translocase subunit SecY [Candidatus Woesearchaeota archaeon]
MDLGKILQFLPEVKKPLAKRLAFNKKLIWTGIILVVFFVLSYIPLFGLGQNALDQFQHLSIILGAKFGSIISLGIGPIVTGSIILQLLSGTGILGIDTTTQEGRIRFQALQKIFTIFFIVFEAIVYVVMGGLAPSPQLMGTSIFYILEIMLIIQLIIGGYLIVLMSEVVDKWGFGSGVGLFIVAGVARQIMVRALNPLPSPTNPEIPVGRIPYLIKALGMGDPTGALIAAAAIISTIVVFVIVVYGQAMKVEIPLSFGRMRGHGIRWPLRFIYTSNIPVILIAALMANINLWARLLQNWGHPILGTFSGNIPASGFVKWIHSPNVINSIITGTANWTMAGQAIIYSLFMIGGAILFSVLWVKTANMDAGSQAKQILSSGLQVPGFRRDPRVLKSILNRYIPALTIMGGAFVGFLAAFADLGGALSRGTGILLAVMIVYRMYEEIAKQHAFDMHPALRKFIAED